MDRPEYLIQGEAARLFPVLSITSKEGRTSSIVLACMALVDEFGSELLTSIGKKVGKRSKIRCYTEIVFKGDKSSAKDRPDGLIVVESGGTTWRALVEAKIGGETLRSEQIEKYREIAKREKIDCVITISNQFATRPDSHPLEEVNKSRSKIPVFHWSWMYVMTAADLLMKNEVIEDPDQETLLYELCRFLSHDSAGVKGFDRMPAEWSDVNKVISANGKVSAKSAEALIVARAWHQETRDLSLILSRKTETQVSEKLPRKLASDHEARLKSDLKDLCEDCRLSTVLEIPDAASPMTVQAHLNQRTISVEMSVRAPEDKVSNKARLNWLLRQLPSNEIENVFIRLNWPGRSPETVFQLSELREDPSLCEVGKDGLQVSRFDIFVSKRLGAKFTQRVKFISELEDLVPWFYQEFGQNLTGWQKPAPKIKHEEQEENRIDLEEMQKTITE